jgi:hypothetical protein
MPMQQRFKVRFLAPGEITFQQLAVRQIRTLGKNYHPAQRPEHAVLLPFWHCVSPASPVLYVNISATTLFLSVTFLTI